MSDNALKRETNILQDSQITSFFVGKELFGIRVGFIKEIVRFPEITTVPSAPAYLKGLVNLRGNILPVIDTKVKFGLPSSEVTEQTRVIVLDMDGRQTGIVVDAVKGVQSLDQANLEPPPDILSSDIDKKFIKNIIKLNNGKDIIMELDTDIITDIEASKKNHKTGNSSENIETSKNVLIKAEDENQLVTFFISQEEYGFPIESVREVLRVSRITEVPEAPDYVLGIFTIRNTLLPVIDLRKLFSKKSYSEELNDVISKLEKKFNDYTAGHQTFTLRDFKSTQDQLNETVEWLDGFRTSSEKISTAIQDQRLLIQNFSAKLSDISTNKTDSDKDKIVELLHTIILKISLKFPQLKESILSEISEDQRILIVDIDNKPVGIMVDRMRQVIRVNSNEIDVPPKILSSQSVENLTGIVRLDKGNRIILFLDEKKLFHQDIVNQLSTLNTDIVVMEEEDKAMKGQSDIQQLVTFKLGKEEFALSIDDVQEINRLDNITAIPKAPSFVEGVMNLRGNVIPAIDLRKRFSMELIAHSESTRVVIVNIGGKLTGMIVDSVSEVLRLPKKNIDPPPDVISSNLNTDFIKGIGKITGQNRFILLVDVNKILSFDEQEKMYKTVSEGVKKSDVLVSDKAKVKEEAVTVKEEQITNVEKEEVTREDVIKPLVTTDRTDLKKDEPENKNGNKINFLKKLR